jgi:small subunit ribosomal protein S8
MAINDTVSDLITRVRNAQGAGLKQTKAPASRMSRAVLEALVREGYIRSYKTNTVRKGVDELEIDLKYYEGKPVIQHLKRLSKPGRRIYAKIQDMPKVANGLGSIILSTAQGILSDAEAREKNIGGELLFEVF